MFDITLLSVWKTDQTLVNVFDITLLSVWKQMGHSLTCLMYHFTALRNCIEPRNIQYGVGYYRLAIESNYPYRGTLWTVK